MDRAIDRQNRRAAIWGAILLMAAAIFFLWAYPFQRQIEQTIPATIYVDGAAADTTTVYINGKKTNYLLQNRDSFSGTFAIACLDKTNRSNAGIYWQYENRQLAFNSIHYLSSGAPADLGVVLLHISEDMEEFCLALADGSIIATSEAELAYSR